jgi:hypothetical protein
VISHGGAGFVGSMSDAISGSGRLNSSAYGIISCGDSTGQGQPGTAEVWNNALSYNNVESWNLGGSGLAVLGSQLQMIVTWTVLVQALVFKSAGGTWAWSGAAFPGYFLAGQPYPTSDSFGIDGGGSPPTGASSSSASFTVTSAPP